MKMKHFLVSMASIFEFEEDRCFMSRLGCCSLLPYLFSYLLLRFLLLALALLFPKHFILPTLYHGGWTWTCSSERAWIVRTGKTGIEREVVSTAGSLWRFTCPHRSRLAKNEIPKTSTRR